MAALSIGIFKRAFMFPFRNFGTLLRLGLFPSLIAFALIAILLSSVIPHIGTPASENDLRPLMQILPWISVALNIVYVVIVSIFAVGIHRLIVRGEYPGWVIFRFGRYELAYAAMLLFFILLYLVQQYAFLGTGWALGLIPGELLDPFAAGRGTVAGAYPETPLLLLLFILVVAVSLWINVRLALALAHAAVTGELSLSASWHAMRGNFWRFVAACLVLAAIAFIAYFVVGTLATILVGGALLTVLPHTGGMLLLAYAVMIPMLGFFSSMFIALISYAYKELVEGRSADAGY